VDQLLKVSDVAGILNVSDDRVYTLAREQIIPTVRVGRSLRFSCKALDEFIDRGGKSLSGIYKHEN